MIDDDNAWSVQVIELNYGEDMGPGKVQANLLGPRGYLSGGLGRFELGPVPQAS